jgi:hypothetical protein
MLKISDKSEQLSPLGLKGLREEGDRGWNRIPVHSDNVGQGNSEV